MSEYMQLRRLAEWTNFGEWELQTGCSWRRIGVNGESGNVLRPTNHRVDGHPDLSAADNVLEYIIAAQPRVVIGLLDRIAELEAQSMQQRQDAYAAGYHRRAWFDVNDDVAPDIGSPVYLKEMADALSIEPQGVQWVPEGYSLLPLKPTDEMVDAGCKQHTCEQQDPWYSNSEISEYDVVKIYSAMLAASPAPKEQEQSAPKGWRDALDGMRSARHTYSQYPELFDVIIDSVEDALSGLEQSQPAEVGALHIIFDGPPGPESGRFVEVETPDGRSVNAGEWRQRADGLWELVIARAQLTEGADCANESVRLHWCKELVRALKRLSFAAQTSGGTAGRDEELCAAIEQAEKAMSMAAASRAIDAAALPTAGGRGELEQAAQFVEQRRDDYIYQHGTTDPDTGAVEFPGNGGEYIEELDEIIEGIRALAAQPAQEQK